MEKKRLGIGKEKPISSDIFLYDANKVAILEEEEVPCFRAVWFGPY